MVEFHATMETPLTKIILGGITALIIAITPSSPQYTYTRQPTIQEQIEQRAIKYEVDKQLLLAVAECESSFMHENIYGDNGLAYGTFQFHENTFNMFAKEYNTQRAKLGLEPVKFQYKEFESQLELFTWAFKNGKQSHWSCTYIVKQKTAK